MNTRLRKFLSYYRPYRGLLLADIACAFAVAVLALVFPLLVRHITQNVLVRQPGLAGQEVLRTAALMLALLCVQCACMYFYDYRGHRMGAMMERDLRNELFAHCQRLPFSYYDAEQTGKLLSRLTNDIYALAELYHHAPENLALYGVKFIGATAVLLLLNTRLAVAVLCLLPVGVAFTLLVGRRMYKAMRVGHERIAEVNAQAEENLSGIRTVKSFAAEALETERFRQANARYADSRSMIYRHEAVFSTGIHALVQCVTIAAVAFGGLAIAGATLALPDLITFLLYIGYLTEPVRALAFMVQQYQQGIAGFHRVMDILELAPEEAQADTPSRGESIAGDVAFDNVSFHYGEGGGEVLRDITFTAKEGETVAVVGHSGVGKTTLCALIPRFYEPTQGSVAIGGRDVREIPLDALRRHVGVVQQDVCLFSGTVAENIAYGRPGADREAIIEAAKRANAHGFIEALAQGYDTQIGQRGVRLSGGQRQRLSIARVFLKDPPILIMDEATSALDHESERIVQDSLDALAKGRTTFIIAHRLSTIIGAKRIVVLSDKGIEEEGTHKALMARGGVYARLYATQIEI